MTVPIETFDSLLKTDVQVRTFKDMQEFAFTGILCVMGCGCFFVGLDLMRDSYGFAWLIQKIIIGVGFLLILGSSAVGLIECTNCGASGAGDVMLAAMDALVRLGFLSGVLSFVGYYFAEEVEILEVLCPFISAISMLVSYLVNFGLCYAI